MASAPAASATSSSLKRRRRSNTTKQNYMIILAALAVIFAAATLIIAVSVILSPAKVNFSITNYTCSGISNSSKTGVRLELTLSANNPSHRAGVEYHRNTTLAYLQYTPAHDVEHKTSVENISMPSPSQSPASTVKINVSASISPDKWDAYFAGRSGTPRATLISLSLIAEVRYKVGPVYTPRHSIKVLCDPVDYFTSTGGNDHHLRPPVVNCTATT